LGINGEPSAPLTVAQYQSGIVTFANLANASGMIVEVDLHFGSGGKCVLKSHDYPGMDQDHASAFWQSVIFNLINEPHSSSEISWSCYLNGGCKVTGKGCSWTVVGTQSVVNTVRATGATNPIIIAGLNYSNDLSQWLTNVPTDSAKAIIARAHVYFDGLACEDSTCWTREYGGIQAASYPVVVDEFGDFKCSTEIDQLMDWADSQTPQVAYWAWSFNPFSCSKGPSLITDTAGDPTSPYGSDFQAHLISVQ
jgi:Cellulase (glycosyl hydrolase family 5)